VAKRRDIQGQSSEETNPFRSLILLYIQPGVPAFTVEQPAEAMEALKQRAIDAQVNRSPQMCVRYVYAPRLPLLQLFHHFRKYLLSNLVRAKPLHFFP